MKKYIGIDLGGTFIKGGIVTEKGEILLQDKVPTEREQGENKVTENIANLCKSLLVKAGLTTADVEGIGMGVPGMIDSEKGEMDGLARQDRERRKRSGAWRNEIRLWKSVSKHRASHAWHGRWRGYRH